MDSALRCPQCFQVPDVTYENNKVVVQCYAHGHMAMGDTMDQAISHWNFYIALTTQEVA